MVAPESPDPHTVHAGHPFAAEEEQLLLLLLLLLLVLSCCCATATATATATPTTTTTTATHINNNNTLKTYVTTTARTCMSPRTATTQNLMRQPTHETCGSWKTAGGNRTTYGRNSGMKVDGNRTTYEGGPCISKIRRKILCKLLQSNWQKSSLWGRHLNGKPNYSK